MLIIDDLNDWVGYTSGHPDAQTPNIDELASRGVGFLNAYSVAPGCSPSRNSVLYGIEPFNSGLYAFYGSDIHAEIEKTYSSLPAFLKKQGYLTFGAGKIHHHGSPSSPQWTGYLEISRRTVKTKDESSTSQKSKYDFSAATEPIETMRDYQVSSYGAEILSTKYKAPIFLALGLTATHLPFRCPQQFVDNVPNVTNPPRLDEKDFQDSGRYPAKKSRGNKRFSGLPETSETGMSWNKIRRAYLSCISYVDYNIGRVMEALDNGPNARNTLLILWSDHGLHIGEKGILGKFTLWKESLKIPFIIYDSRQSLQSGIKVNAPVTPINIFKTVSDAAGITPPDYVDGVSLMPLLSGLDQPEIGHAVSTNAEGSHSVRTGDWTFIKYSDGSEELYDAKMDPHELNNLSYYEDNTVIKAQLEVLLPRNPEPTVSMHAFPWSLRLLRYNHD